jgi:lysophospholipase L1-like esterase
LLATLLLGSFSTSAALADQIPLAGQRVLILGDSITQGGEYVSFLEYYLNKLYPNQHFDIVSIGLSSETVDGLSEKAHPFPRPCVHERLWAALDMVRPAIVFACYGINDGIYHPQSPERMAAFEAGIIKLIGIDAACGAKTVLLTPPPFDPVPVKANTRPADAPDFSYMNPYENYDTVVADYAAWELSLPPASAQVIDLHTALSTYLAAQRKIDPSFKFSGDGIHPNPAGNLLMAQTILAGLGAQLHAGPLDQDLAKITSDPLFVLVDKRRQTRSNGWLEYVGYTRDGFHKSMSIDQTEQQCADLQEPIDKLRVR